ncbi:DUF378 domain-containing protein [Thalassobacillus sp. CUG 92003]|uniref:DUF378 domain-containing protein n=1 Tax=Thalassobacillus sp. CUG 92003 TaxID=2736641 RepID=UPI0015E7D510|nr:DUF378 domain-containing protein [Thalassobacillus sp. CUG 92003]
MNTIQKIALILVIIGAINWGLIGLFQYDLVAGLFGGGEQSGAFARVIYTLVGISGLVAISLFMSEEEMADQRVEEPTK